MWGEKEIKINKKPEQKLENVNRKKQIQEKIDQMIISETTKDKINRLEKISIESEIKVDVKKGNCHDEFLSILEPKLKDKKILDLFCGGNVIKKYFKEKGLNAEVIGVDLIDEKADIKTDIKEIDKFIQPQKQFDIIAKFGGIDGVMNLDVIKDYLKDDGIYLTDSSEWWFHNCIEPVFNNIEIARKEIPNDEKVKILNYFQPVMALEIKNIKTRLIDGAEEKLNEVYIIWKKINKKKI